MDIPEHLLCINLCAFSDNGSGNLSALMSQLEKTGKVLKELCDNGKIEDAVTKVTALVDAYFHCLTCSKISKPIGKVLIRVHPSLQSIVEKEMKMKIDQIITDASSLDKVSALLEQSKLGHDLIREHLPSLCSCLENCLENSRHSHTERLCQRDSIKLQLVVKITVQVMQHFQEDVEGLIHDASDSSLKKNFLNLIQALLNTMCQNEHDSDVYLFGGTMLAMLLNLSLDSKMAIQTFENIQQVLAHKSKSCLIGSLPVTVEYTTDCERRSISELAFLRGVIMCSSENILVTVCEEITYTLLKERTDLLEQYGSKGGNPLLVELFPLLLGYCQDSSINQYHSFQVLSLWFKRLQKCLPLIPHRPELSFTSKCSLYLTETLKQVFLNWDSPVDGVSDYVGEIFHSILEVWRWERTKGLTDNESFVQDLLQQFLEVPWNVKGKYRLIGVLLPNTDIKKVVSHSSLKQHMLSCMGTNNLAPLASDVYKIWLQLTGHLADEDRLELWKESWLGCLITGLVSNQPLLRKKLGDYWLPLTLKILPTCATFLSGHLANLLQRGQCPAQRKHLLYVWLLVTRIIRSNRGLDEEDFDVPLLTEGLYSGDDDTRGEVVAFLCGTMKKSELLTKTECMLLKSCLPLCLRVDSAPFRQHLAANIKKLLVRLRDGCLSAMKKKQEGLTNISLEFLDWLHKTLIDSLFPGASYQRLKTSLDLLSILYDTLVFVQDGGTQKGQAEERCSRVLELAQSHGQCEFFTQETTTIMLSCIMDGADEDLSSQLLMKFFPWNKPWSPYTVDDLASHLLDTAFKLCTSPRPYESRSGALLCNLVYIKYVCDQGMVFTKQKGKIQLSQSCEMKRNSSSKFIELLMREIEYSINRAEQDPVSASQDSPLHGLIQTVTLCLRSRAIPNESDDLLLSLVKVNVKVIQMMMSVMSGGRVQENCPSFAEMGMALESLVSEGEGESLSLTPEFQMMLSWCWVNLKESCTCLGELTSALVKSKSDHTKWLPELRNVGQIFIQVLTNCRVRGAIEGCRNGLLKYCTVLLASDHKTLASIPADILHQIMSSLEGNVMSASVTRRSAGLPIMIQIIAQAEHKLKQQTLLLRTVETLLRLASLPYNQESDQKQDLVQVHALNILKAVFSDASLVVSLISSFTKVLLIIFDGFESPSWAIRNAATQLFGTMISRMFGPRSKGGTSHNIMTLQELSAHYPGLPAAMLEKLTLGVKDFHNIDNLHASVFLVLTILANLGSPATSGNLHKHHHQLMEKVRACLETPVFTLRELSAHAFIAFVPSDTGEQEVLQLANNLPSSISEKFKHNSLHGTLLCIEKLILRHQFTGKEKHNILSIFLTKSWILTQMDHCPLLGAKYAQVMKHLIQCDGVTDQGEEILELLKKCDKTGYSNKLKIGSGLMVRDSVICVTNVLRDNNTKLSIQMCTWLCSDNMDTCISCLEELAAMVIENRSLDWGEIQIPLWNLLRRSSNNTILTNTMNLLCDVYLSLASLSVPDFSLSDLHKVTRHTEHNSNLNAASIPVEAILVGHLLKGVTLLTDEIANAVRCWSKRVRDASDPVQSDTTRTAAARALLVAGEITLNIFARRNKCTTKDTENTSTSLIESVFNLLEDGESDIRKMATKFVSGLRWDTRQIQFDDINSLTCQEMFGEYLSDKLSWSVSVVNFLLMKLYQPGEATAACQNNRINSKVKVLFEQEPASVMSESPLQKILLHSTVKNLLRAQTVVAESCLSDLAKHALKDMESCLPILINELKEFPLINISSDSSVLSSLTGLILVADVAITVPDVTEAAVIQGLKTELATLLQIQNLYPWLAIRLSGCLTGEVKGQRSSATLRQRVTAP